MAAGDVARTFLLLMVFVVGCIKLSVAANGSKKQQDVARVTTETPRGRSLWTSPSVAVDPYAYLPALPGQRPDCAGPDETYCTKIKGYPRDLIRYLLERSSHQHMLLNETGDQLILEETTYGHYSTNDTTSKDPWQPGGEHRAYPMPQNETTVSSVYNPKKYFQYHHQSRKPFYPHGGRHHRYKRQTDDGDLCPTSGAFVQPRAAMNSQGNWKYVVNLREVNPRFTQLVRAETCVSSECRGVCEIPLGFQSSCRQQYVQKRLVSLEGDGVLSNDVFWFPHCCTCQIRREN